MVETSLKSKLTLHVAEFMTALLLIQPLLDVLSYFLWYSSSPLTTIVRFFLLVSTSLYGFLISDQKYWYAALYGVIGGFWLLHALNCFRVGYVQPIDDLSAFLKMVQFPLWTVSFFTFFRKREGLDLQITGVLTVNFALILLVIGLSYLTGRPVYTYDFPERSIQIGALGWFGAANAQSAIRCLLFPALLLWGYQTKKLWIFSLCCFSGAALLYFTGTRLTFYAAVLTAAAFAVLIFLARRQLAFCFPALAVLVLLLLLRGVSPMEQRQQVTYTSFSVYQEKIDAIMGEDKDFTYEEGQEIPEQVMKKITAVYRDIYCVKGVYGETLLGDLVNKYGLERIMKEFDYSIQPQVLNNSRIRKIKAMDMVWEEEDFLTHLLGMEVVEGNHYDPENDFNALVFYMGYLGTALYVGFILWILFYAILAFFRRFPVLVTVEFGGAACMFALALGAAQFSGWTFRWPNVTVYFSLAAALLLSQAEAAPPVERLRPGHKRNPAVYLKKIG